MSSQINLQTDLQPGKRRDPFLEVQMQKITQAINALFTAVHTELTRIVIIDQAISTNDYWILVDATAGNIQLTLPHSANASHRVGVKKIDASANTVTVIPAGTETADGTSGVTLAAQYDNATFVSDGLVSWYIF